MKENIIKVDELPEEISFNSTLEIASNNVNRYTHGFFKYPCKFIPHIPRWAIKKYTSERDTVVDPFAGSGTTLLESVILKRNGLGIDFDNFSHLLCKAKTKPLSSNEIEELESLKDTLFINSGLSNLPDIHNIEHWFPKKNIEQLRILKNNIDKLLKKESLYNFLLVCFATTIRRCSYADKSSPKPYVSSRIKKEPENVKPAFLKTFNSNLKKIRELDKLRLGKVRMISRDARKIEDNAINNTVNLAVTSPPYINAFDYVRSLRLENAWLGYYGDNNIIEVKRKQIGTETISSKLYLSKMPIYGIKKLDVIILKIYEKDKKRAYVVYQFFKDMEENIKQIYKLLKPKSHYIIVVGDSLIRDVVVDTHNILIDVAKKNGFDLVNLFSYVIKNRYLRIPRKGRGGLIKKDWVIDLVKR
jgi:DNA modification methylase